MVFFGCGSMILAELNPEMVTGFIPLVWGAAVAAMIYAVGHISGAHFNPAVTLGFWSVGRFPLARVPGYLLSQFLGALLASGAHKILWPATVGFGMTEFSVPLWTGILAEVIISFALMFVIMSVATDARAVGELAGIAIGVTVALAAFVIGPITKASMNPARSLGPAIFASNLTHLWAYFIAPVAGTLLGARVYEWIRCQREDDPDGHGCC